MSAPREILLLRAISHFDRAQLELVHGQTTDGKMAPVGSPQVAAEWIDRGIALVKEALENG